MAHRDTPATALSRRAATDTTTIDTVAQHTTLIEDLTPDTLDALPPALRERLSRALDNLNTQLARRRRKERDTKRAARAKLRQTRRASKRRGEPQPDRSRKARRARDRQALEHATPSDTTIPLEDPRPCYVCKALFRRVTDARLRHHCPDCAKLEHHHRELWRTVDLRGRVALITGGRITIGFETARMLLRAGADVHITTRFPHDAARRFADLPEARPGRLHIHALELSRLDHVEAFADTLDRTLPHLDILINNAAQTVRRPASWHHAMNQRELQTAPTLTHTARRLLGITPQNPCAMLTSTTTDDAALFSPDLVSYSDGDPLDLRQNTTWRQTLDAVSPREILEAHLINTIAPTLLTRRLKPTLMRSPHTDRYIVQVSAMEGQFSRGTKTPHHPHTNMAKAALNMLTRTAARDYAQSGIHMVSVDTGWVTDMRPTPDLDTLAEREAHPPPLDSIAGAARVAAPIFDGVASGRPRSGVFLKDFVPVRW